MWVHVNFSIIIHTVSIWLTLSLAIWRNRIKLNSSAFFYCYPCSVADGSGSRIWKNSLRIRIRIQIKLWNGSWSDPEPGKNDTYPDPGKKGFSTMQENLKKIVKNVNFYCLVCLYILLTYHFSINNQLIIEIMSKQSSYLRLFSVCNVFCWIRRYIPTFDTDPDLQNWCNLHSSRFEK